MPYQDIFIKGETVEKGDRECTTRFECLDNFFKSLSPKFTMVDIGANMGYFSFRTAHKYPKSRVTMVDPDPKLLEIAAANGLPNTNVISKLLSTQEILDAANHYDVALAMSIAHHFKDPVEAINAIAKVANYSIFEIYAREAKCMYHTERVPIIFDHMQELQGTLINRHIDAERPLYCVSKVDKRIAGIVHGGCGHAKNTVKDFQKELKKITGTSLYHGTLNVKLDTPETFLNHADLEECRCRIYPATMHGFKVFFIRPNYIEYPTDEIEVMCKHSLRELFKLNDGDKVEFLVPFYNIEK